MDYEDRISIDTPEGVALDLTLAGLGSRFVASVIDTAISWGIILALLLLIGLLASGSSSGGGDGGGDGTGAVLFAFAVITVLLFLAQFGYYVLFETLASGRTPGKRLAGLRVVTETGAPVGFVASALRNLVRLVDILPGTYLVGTIAIFFSKRNQRLGDMAAGTVVVRERRGVADIPLIAVGAQADNSWDVAGVSASDLATVRRFLARRATLTAAARDRLGNELAEVLRPKVVGADDALDDEAFLETLAATKASRA